MRTPAVAPMGPKGTALTSGGMPLAARSGTASIGSEGSDPTKPRLVFHWFRNDLRLHDNPTLAHSASNSDVCVPVYVFDAKWFGNDATTPWGSLKWGPKRAKFLLESIQDLRERLKSLPPSCTSSKGSVGLVVAHGDIGAVFERLVDAVKDSYQVSVVTQDEPLQEEADSVREVQGVLQRLLTHQQKEKTSSSPRIRTVWGSTLYELAELPFDSDLRNLPDIFTPFRTKVEKACKIPRPLPIPRFSNSKKNGAKLEDILSTAFVETKADLKQNEGASATTIRGLSLSFLPTLESLGYTDEQIKNAHRTDSRGVLVFEGGETRALERVRNYVWDEPNLLQTYFDTRNGMIGTNYSTKFSPWLALGCLSPRYVAAEVARYEERVVRNKSTYWLIFELLWRDYCKFFCVKHGNRVFYRDGIVSERNKKEWSTNVQNWEAWKNGQTGYPLVDANMRELKATGWMSNRGRQNVCSFLAIDLGHDWRRGADWFESQLLDYDVYSNWVNWCSGAGMTGGRLNRFNIVKQSKDYDQHGEYVRLWIPELKDVPTELVHEPWKMTQFQQMQYNVQLGLDYPNPIVPPFQPKPYERRDSEARKDSSTTTKGKQRKPNRGSGNKHQKYEMKSLKEGRFELK